MEKRITKIIDVSWGFGVTAASSDTGKVGKSFMQLKICLDEGGKITNHFIEMTIPEFYWFFHDLEKAKMQLDSLV